MLEFHNKLLLFYLSMIKTQMMQNLTEPKKKKKNAAVLLNSDAK